MLPHLKTTQAKNFGTGRIGSRCALDLVAFLQVHRHSPVTDEPEMKNQILSQNLRLLCSYGKSTSEICRQVGINRHQFSKYLSGKSEPSLSTLRRICDYFGVDEYEIFLDRNELSKIIDSKHIKKRVSESNYIERILFQSEKFDRISEYTGFYFVYTPSNNYKDSAIKSFMQIKKSGEYFYTTTIDRNIEKHFKLPKTLTYKGFVSFSDNNLLIHERSINFGNSFVTYMINTRKKDENFLTGLILISLPDVPGQIASMRVVLQFIGSNPNIRESMRRCGLFKKKSREIPDFVGNYLLDPKVDRYYLTGL